MTRLPSTIDWHAVALAATQQAATPSGAAEVGRLAQHLARLDLEEVPPHVGEVALAYAAASGEPTAQIELHRRIVDAARASLPRAGYSAHVVDDTIGELALKLLCADSPLLTYRGQAALVSWLRTLVARTAIRLTDASRDVSVQADDRALAEQLLATDMLRELSRGELRSAVRNAFEIAIGRLSYFERALLGDVILRGRTVEDLSRAHGVHRATVARWTARIRVEIDQTVRTELGRVLGSEVDSVLDSALSSIELSLERLLRT